MLRCRLVDLISIRHVTIVISNILSPHSMAIWKEHNRTAFSSFLLPFFMGRGRTGNVTHVYICFLLTLTVLGKFFSGWILKKVINVKKANNLLQDNNPKKWGQSWITPNMACILYFMNMHVGSYIFWSWHLSHSPKNEVTLAQSMSHAWCKSWQRESSSYQIVCLWTPIWAPKTNILTWFF
jgi:hypothetical protein